MATFDSGVAILVLAVTYYGHHGKQIKDRACLQADIWTANRARWMGFGALFVAVASLLMTMPHFFGGSYEAPEPVDLICEVDRPSNDCLQDHKGAYPMFIFAIILMALGASPVFTLGSTLIDDIIDPKAAPKYLGIFLSMSLFGPALGMQKFLETVGI